MSCNCDVCVQNMKRRYESEIERLKLEIKLLRQYGNKDCTAQADEALEEHDKK